MLGQALDEALGDRSGIARYGDAIVPDGRGARARCAIDISGPPVLRRSRRDLPPTSIAGFDDRA